MRYDDFTLVVSPAQSDGYLVSAWAEPGRVSASLPFPTAELKRQLDQVAERFFDVEGEATARLGGEALFRWLLGGEIAAHFRIAWDRAQRSGVGLRLRLTIDAPELAAWPWELLHDPERDYAFATSQYTPLVRFYDQTNRFGGFADGRAELPLDLLLVLPSAPDLNLEQEQRNLEGVVKNLPGILRLRVLDGVVTRADLADTLLLGDYDIVHFGGHGAFIDGQGYVNLNSPDRRPDWIHSGELSRLAVNHKSIRLIVLNACSSGQVDDVRAFQGLAPQMVRYGVPAVVAMQYPIADAAAATFSREFYKRLCLGEDAGQVDVALTYARSMLAVLHPGERNWAAPVLHTHTTDSAIYDLPAGRPQVADLDPSLQRQRLAELADSLAASVRAEEDWTLAEPEQLFAWQRTLRKAEEAYQAHISDSRPDVQQVAERGLAGVRARLAALEHALGAVLAQQRPAT